MVYNKHEWRDGELITSDNLNNMENGIQLAYSIQKGDKGDKGDTGVQGPKGDTGATGAQGPAGKDGSAASIGDDVLNSKIFKTRSLPTDDFNEILQNPTKFAGTFSVAGEPIKNTPFGDLGYALVKIENAYADSALITITNLFGNENIRVITIGGNKVTAFYEIDKSILARNEMNNDTSLSELISNKALYTPYEIATFSAKVEANRGKIIIDYFRREDLMHTQIIPFLSDGTVEWSWGVPGDDNEQYIARIKVIADKNESPYYYYALNVAQDSKSFPIMGALTEYSTFDPDAQKNVINYFNRHHVNYIQYYDCYLRPEQPIPYAEMGDDVLSGGEYWKDLSRHPVRRDVIAEYIKLGKSANMKNMLYGGWGNTSYNDDEHHIDKNMLLFNKPGADRSEVPITLGGGKGQWARYNGYMADPSSSVYQNMSYAANMKAFQVLPFDGWHIDTLGPNYGTKYRADGTTFTDTYAGTTAMPAFVNNANTFFENNNWQNLARRIRLGFNNVGAWGIDSLANNNNLDYLYSEQWEDMGNKTYADMHNMVKRLNKLDSHGVIIPAYIHSQYSGDGNYDEVGVKLLDLVIMASGGTHLELAEYKLIRGAYFPAGGLSMSDDLKNWLERFYDFMVAYRRLFRLNNYTEEATTDIDTVHNWIDSTKPSIIEMSDEYMGGYSIINTMGIGDDDWCDNQRNKKDPTPIKKMKMKFKYTPSSVYYADLENPVPRKLELDSSDNSVTLENISLYGFVYTHK